MVNVITQNGITRNFIMHSVNMLNVEALLHWLVCLKRAKGLYYKDFYNHSSKNGVES